MDTMKEALKRRKGQSIDLTIVLGGPEGDAATINGISDLAPDQGGSPELKDEQEMKPEGEIAPDKQPEEGIDDEMISGLSDYDKKDMESRKPKSLMDRAMMDAMNRKKEK